MTREELQLVADTCWIILGPDGFGCNVIEELLFNGFTIQVAGFEDGTMYSFSETISRNEVETRRGDPRYNYIREVTRCIRKAITDLRMCQIKSSLGE